MVVWCKGNNVSIYIYISLFLSKEKLGKSEPNKQPGITENSCHELVYLEKALQG